MGVQIVHLQVCVSNSGSAFIVHSLCEGGSECSERGSAASE